MYGSCTPEPPPAVIRIHYNDISSHDARTEMAPSFWREKQTKILGSGAQDHVTRACGHTQKPCENAAESGCDRPSLISGDSPSMKREASRGVAYSGKAKLKNGGTVNRGGACGETKVQRLILIKVPAEILRQ